MKIYFITDGENIKIGRSKNVEQRIKQLQTSNSINLKLLYYLETEDVTFETHVHNVCQRFRVKGEWFKPEAINHLINHPWFKKHMVKVESG